MSAALRLRFRQGLSARDVAPTRTSQAAKIRYADNIDCPQYGEAGVMGDISGREST